MPYTSAGVSSSVISGSIISGPTAMMIRLAMNVSVRQVPTLASSSSCLCAPKYCDTRMPAPVEMPMNSSSRRLRIGPLAPTAASALSPTYWPTMIESAVLYICCARLPISSGTEKTIRLLSGLPTVMSCAPKNFFNRFIFLFLSLSSRSSLIYHYLSL